MTGRHVRVGITEAPDLATDINLAQIGIRERITRRPTDLRDEEASAVEAAVKRHPAGSKLNRVGGEAA